MGFIKSIFHKKKEQDSSVGEHSSTESSEQVKQNVTRVNRIWVEDDHADINSSDLFEQAKAYDLGIGVEPDKAKAAQLYLKAMMQGDKRAKHNLAVLYLNQEELDTDIATGIQMLRELADEGLLQSIYSLGGCYMTGLGVEKDVDKGLELFHKASEMGYGIATYAIGAYYINELQDIEKGIKYCEKAIEQGHSRGAGILEQVYAQGIGVPVDLDKAKTYLKRAAELGDPRCQLKYGVSLFDEDVVVAMDWMIKSAKQHYPSALLLVGREYLNKNSHLFSNPQHFSLGIDMLREAAGLGVEEAVDFLSHYGLEVPMTYEERYGQFLSSLESEDREAGQKAVDQMYWCCDLGDPMALCIIGSVCYYGTFINEDKEKGFELIKMACDSDDVEALNIMGVLLNKEGRYEEALPYHQRSAEKGDMFGLHNMGNAYFFARAVEHDLEKAIHYWQEAAKLGNPDSYCTLGNIFFRGEFTDQDIPKAIKFYQFAANHQCASQATAIRRLAEAYRLLGDEASAKEWEDKLKGFEQ